MKKRNQKRNQSSSVIGQRKDNLTETDRLLLSYLKDNLTVQQIAIKHDCSSAFVRKTRLKLIKLGLYFKLSRKVTDTPPHYVTNVTTPPSSNKELCRLHAQKFRIELIKPIDERYKKLINTSLRIDGNSIQCFYNCVCVQAMIGRDFSEKTEDLALSKSMEYWNNFFIKLENRLNTPIIKDQKMNIKMTYSEWATTPCELSKECSKKNEQVRIYANDGKLRYTTDHSLNFEREAYHHITGKRDSETVNRYIKDILDHPELDKPSEFQSLVTELTQNNLNLAELLKSHMNLTQTELSAVFTSLKSLTDTLNQVVKLNQPPSIIQEEQTTIRPKYIG